MRIWLNSNSPFVAYFVNTRGRRLPRDQHVHENSPKVGRTHAQHRNHAITRRPYTQKAYDNTHIIATARFSICLAAQRQAAGALRFCFKSECLDGISNGGFHVEAHTLSFWGSTWKQETRICFVSARPCDPLRSNEKKSLRDTAGASERHGGVRCHRHGKNSSR